MSNPLAKRADAADGKVNVAPEIVAVKFTEHGRSAENNRPIRELRAAQGATITEDDKMRGVWLGKVLVPWANILWVEYA